MLLRGHRKGRFEVGQKGVFTRKCVLLHAKEETPREFFSVDLFVYPHSG